MACFSKNNLCHLLIHGDEIDFKVSFRTYLYFVFVKRKPINKDCFSIQYGIEEQRHSNVE